jgi:histidine triad (HIT) family protein
MENCVFCKIVKGEIPATKLYEDEIALSFLDINPASKGHSLVIPKKHYPTMLDIPEMELAEIIKTVQRIGAAAMKATKADGFNIIQNNKEAAGQVVHHLHFHVVPRFKNDGLKLSFGSKLADFNELQKWEKEYKKHL